MKTYLRKLVLGAVIGLGMGLGLLAAHAAPLPSISIANGGNFPADFADIQALINNLNAAINNWLTLNNSLAEQGEIALSNANAFAVNGSVATAMSSVGPVGSHTTIQKWLTVVDNSGNVLYAPLF